MFDQILQLVKEHINGNPELAGVIPAEHADAIHHEIASHLSNQLQHPAPAQGGMGGILSEIESSLGSGNLATNAITGGLVGSLAGRFGLSPAITGAITAALPGLIQKYINKNAAGPVPAVS